MHQQLYTGALLHGDFLCQCNSRVFDVYCDCCQLEITDYDKYIKLFYTKCKILSVLFLYKFNSANVGML